MSIIEVIVAIFIFTIWLSSIYLVITSSINLNEYGKNQIIASNLAREWLELVKNLRDSNYSNLHNWNSINPNLSWNYELETNLIQTWTYYKIELDYETIFPDFSVRLEKIDDFKEWKEYVKNKMKDYELCINNAKKYTYDCNLWNKKTGIYRYIKFEDLTYKDASWNDIVVNDAYKVISKVLWYKNGYHEINLTTILANHKRL
jgi:Tfp pilus assembly protein PilV